MRIGFIVFIYLCMPMLIVWAFQKWSWAQKVGTVIMAYAVGIVLSLSNLTVFESGSAEAETMRSIQKWIMDCTVPLAIPLMLLGSDFRMWAKSLPKTIIALVGGLFAVVVAVCSGFFVFRDCGIENFSDLAAMMIGIYTGGTMNFAALGASLHIDSTIMTCLLTIEMLITFPLILFIVGGGYHLFRTLLPYESKTVESDMTESAKITDVEDYSGMLSGEILPKIIVALLLALAFVGVGVGLSYAVCGGINEMVVIVTVTTLAICASFCRKIRELPKTFEMGMVLILMFSVVVASQFDFYMLRTTIVTLVYFVLFVLLVSILLHFIVCKIFKIEGDLFVVANIGLLCSPPFIPPVVGAMGNKKVLVSGLAIGLVGYAVGTYIGLALAYVLGML